MVDPAARPLPSRYRELASGRRVRLGPEPAVPRRAVPSTPSSAPPPGRNWFMWLVDHARGLGLDPAFFALNLRGQRVGFSISGERPRG